MYMENEDLQEWFKSLFCLALIPIDRVDVQWEKIQEEKANKISIGKYLILPKLAVSSYNLFYFNLF